MRLKLIYKAHYFRVIICAILATTIGFQTLYQSFNIGFNTDHGIEWSDTSDSNESDQIDVEEKEQKKEFKHYFFTRSKTAHLANNNTAYHTKKHPVVSIDINLPPPKSKSLFIVIT